MSESGRATVARTVVRAAALVAAVTIVARLVGFLRTAVLGRVLGATFLGDTYTATNALPNVVYEIVAAVRSPASSSPCSRESTPRRRAVPPVRCSAGR